MYLQSKVTISNTMQASQLSHKIEFNCEACGSLVIRTIRGCISGKYGLRCSKCTHDGIGLSRTNSLSIVKDLIHSRNCTLLSTEYVDSHTKLDIKCKCGNTYQQSLSDFRSIYRNGRENCCPSCSRSKVRLAHLYTTEYVAKRISETGCKLLSGEYQSYDTKLTIECRRCKTPFINSWKDFYNNGTFACSACTENSISESELEIQSFLTENNIGFKANVRGFFENKQELDILTDNNVAIEFNGIFYHSEKYGRMRQYHKQKTKNCLEKQVQLLHIWDHEWTDRKHNKKDIWKSMILVKLKKIPHTNRIHARSCEVRPLQSKEANVFLNENHLQGEDNAKIRLGLFYKDELVQVMTFSSPRYNKHYEYEMIRNSSKKYHIVVGGSSKLLSHFKTTHDPQSIITYADLRYSDGKIYKTLGFIYSHISPPSYFYTNGNRIVSRIQAQKHKLSNIFDNFDEQQSEKENMAKNNFFRVWDCGCMVFCWKKP